MNKFEIFNYGNKKIRTIMKDNEMWFVGKDVAEILGYARARKAILDHVDSDDKGVLKQSTLGGIQDVTIINESGLYSLILSSKLDSAKKFKKWVTKEVLPTIRKHGMYATDELLNNPDFAIEVLKQLKQEREEKQKYIKEIEEQKPKVIFADSVTASHTSILVGELAKILKQNGIDIGQNRLFQKLRDLGYLISRNGTDFNMPTQKSMNLGLFEIKETSVTHADGHISISKTPKITGKGQVYFINKFNEKLI